MVFEHQRALPVIQLSEAFIEMTAPSTVTRFNGGLRVFYLPFVVSAAMLATQPVERPAPSRPMQPRRQWPTDLPTLTHPCDEHLLADIRGILRIPSQAKASGIHEIGMGANKVIISSRHGRYSTKMSSLKPELCRNSHV